MPDLVIKLMKIFRPHGSRSSILVKPKVPHLMSTHHGENYQVDWAGERKKGSCKKCNLIVGNYFINTLKQCTGATSMVLLVVRSR